MQFAFSESLQNSFGIFSHFNLKKIAGGAEPKKKSNLNSAFDPN